MRATRRLTIAAAAIGSIALVSPAWALHYICELHGTAQFSPGLSAATTPLDDALDFAFQGDLTNCQGNTGGGQHLCAVGKLHAPSCLENLTEGQQFVICAGPCVAVPGEGAGCEDPNEDPIIESSFSGACAGVVCTGNNLEDGAAYAVVFDQPTIQAALSACNPIAPGPPLTSGGFDGYEIRQHDD
jgi:hypothetical protein